MKEVQLLSRVRWGGRLREPGDALLVQDEVATRWKARGIATIADEIEQVVEVSERIPADFPGATALYDAGVTHLEQLDGLSEADLTAIVGIGVATARKILAER